MNRTPKSILLALALGAGIGAFDIALLMWQESGIRVLSPIMETLQVLTCYGAMAAAFAVGLGLIKRNWTAISVAATAAAAVLFLDAYIWVHSRILTNQSMFDLRSILASLAVVVGCVVFAYLVRALAKKKFAPYALAIFVIAPSLMPMTRGVHLDAELRELAKPDLPNVTILLLDTLRADRLSCYGYQRPDGKKTSPVIDDLADQGVLFQWHYAAAPWTRPSVASMFSGLYPTSHGAFLPTRALPGWTANMAEMFQGLGYRTAGFSSNANISAVWGFAQGFEEFWCLDDKELIDMSAWGDAANKLRRIFKFFHDTPDNAQIVNAQAFPWIERMQGSDRPVFTYVQYLDPHFPYHPVEDIINDDLPNYDELVSRVESKTDTLQPFPFGSRDRPAADLIEGFGKLYDAEIAFMDREIGVMVDKLRSNGLLGPDDWLIITSDHGEEFFEHEQWGHGQNLYQEVIRVPLIVIGPGVPNGRVIETPVSLVDLLPTLAQIVGDEDFLQKGAKQKTETGLIDSVLPGRTMQPLWATLDPEDPRHVYSEKLRQPSSLALRMGDHKLVQVDYKKAADESTVFQYDTLYDLAADPLETAGFFGEDMEDHPLPSHLQNRFGLLPEGLDQALAELRDAMTQIHDQAQRLQQSVETKELSSAELQRLIDLGYIQPGQVVPEADSKKE
jgi:arylsulfatase A-like enzyme